LSTRRGFNVGSAARVRAPGIVRFFMKFEGAEYSATPTAIIKNPRTQPT
jgi:hypothetical protein